MTSHNTREIDFQVRTAPPQQDPNESGQRALLELIHAIKNGAEIDIDAAIAHLAQTLPVRDGETLASELYDARNTIEEALEDMISTAWTPRDDAAAGIVPEVAEQ